MNVFERILLVTSAIALAGAFATQGNTEEVSADARELCLMEMEQYPGYSEAGTLTLSGEPFTFQDEDGVTHEVPYDVLTVSIEDRVVRFDTSNTDPARLGQRIEMVQNLSPADTSVTLAVSGKGDHAGTFYAAHPIISEGRYLGCARTAVNAPLQ